MKRIIFCKTKFLIISVFIAGIIFSADASAQTYLVNSGKVVFAGSSTQLTVDNLVNSIGSNLNLNGGTVNIKGILTNNGTYDETGTIAFTGNSPQTLTGVTTLNNLTINNPNGVSLSSDIVINNNLVLSNGILSIGSYNLTLSSSAIVSGSFSSSRMINASGTGQLIKKLTSAGSFTYPIGDNANYSPLSVNFSSGTFGSGASLGANLRNSKHANNTSSNDYLNRYWTLTPSGITSFSYDLILGYNTSDVTGNESNIYTGMYSGSSWALYNQANVISHTLSISNATGFGEFTGGQQGSMPVELISYNSFIISRDVNIKWVTSKEKDNAGFKIERMKTDENGKGIWEQVGFINGKGSTNTLTEYSFLDKKLSVGKYKYRLRQSDYNGNISIFYLNNDVEILKPVKYSLSQNYPNPFNPSTKIDFEITDNDLVSLKIYDITGRNVYTVLNNEYKAAGYFTININTDKFSSGVFLYKLETSKYSQVKKMIKLK